MSNLGREILMLLGRIRAGPRTRAAVRADDAKNASFDEQTRAFATNDIHLEVARHTGNTLESAPQPEPQPPAAAASAAAPAPAPPSELPPRMRVAPMPTTLLERSRSLLQPPSRAAQLAQRFVPNFLAHLLRYQARVFCANFSGDGLLFLVGTQDHHVMLYSLANPRRPKLVKDTICSNTRWSVLDVDYSPDKRFYAYSGWAHTVGLCNVYGSFELHENLVFNEDADRFCLFSVRFSPDNREIVGGANDAHLYVYDVERKQVVTRTLAHHDDINTAVFADASAQVIFTGSDDTLIKVWDRREMRGGVEDDAHRERAVPQRPSSYLIGHGEGITFIDSKSDGRYLASNSKDQSLKLWDLRRATTSDEKASEARRRGGGFDYRFGLPEDVVDELVRPAADDLSIKTFRGHGVLETLIRCRFSPAWSTGQRYIYTGSHGGTVFVYDTLTGECVNRLIGHHRTVRDVHWHPFQPLIITSSWDGSVGMWKYHSVSAAGGPRQSSGRERAAAESPRMAAQSSTDEAGESELSDTDDEEEVARGAEGGAQEDGDEYEGEDSDV